MERNRKGKKTNAFNAVDCAHQTSTLQFYVRGKSIIVITTLLLRQTLSSTSNICAFASTVAQRNAMLITFFFHLKIEKKEEKLTFSAATVVTNSRSCTVATCPQFLFSIFFANNQNTPSRHCHNRSQGPKQHCVGSGDE